MAQTIIELNQPTQFPTGTFVNTRFIITNDCYLNSKLELGLGCTLEFRGGKIFGQNPNAKIKGNATSIIADEYQIFQNVMLEGSFTNKTLSAHWFGVKGDGATNDAPAIQLALDNARSLTYKIPVKLCNLKYKLNSPIYLDYNYASLICPGILFTEYPQINLLVLTHSFLKVDISRIEYEKSEDIDGDQTGSAVLFMGNVYNSDININEIKNFKTGLDLSPIHPYRNIPLMTIIENGEEKKVPIEYAGLQYNRIRWQEIQCETGINLYINSTPNDYGILKTLWINENQFFGGRLTCKNGIKIEGRANDDNVNGNVFNCIGFEGPLGSSMELPISISSARYLQFNDLRMSESIKEITHNDNGTWFESTYIHVNNSQFINFKIKSIFQHNFLTTIDSKNITVEAGIADIGKATDFNTKLIVYESSPIYDDDTQIVQKYCSSQNIPQNYYKQLYYEENATINFDDLFVKGYDNQRILSNICRIDVWSNNNTGKTISIDLHKSCYKTHPDMTICFFGDNVSKLVITNSGVSGFQDMEITKHGTYKITFLMNENVRVVPIAQFELNNL